MRCHSRNCGHCSQASLQHRHVAVHRPHQHSIARNGDMAYESGAIHFSKRRRVGRPVSAEEANPARPGVQGAGTTAAEFLIRET